MNVAPVEASCTISFEMHLFFRKSFLYSKMQILHFSSIGLFRVGICRMWLSQLMASKHFFKSSLNWLLTIDCWGFLEWFIVWIGQISFSCTHCIFNLYSSKGFGIRPLWIQERQITEISLTNRYFLFKK